VWRHQPGGPPVSVSRVRQTELGRPGRSV
jgi:hypothetical protein